MPNCEHNLVLIGAQNADQEEEAELNVFCVTCGLEVPQKIALRHMEKCYNKVRSDLFYEGVLHFCW